jgi:hypothetical protein
MAKPQCTATTKAGKPCKATARHDTGLCNAHSPKEIQESSGFGGAQPGAGRPRNPRSVDILRERIEENIDRWLQPLEDGLTADRGIVVGDGQHARVEYVADHGTRIKAHREGFDRAYGRPTQPVTSDSPSVDEQIERYLAEMDRHDPGRHAVANANGYANGNGSGPH